MGITITGKHIPSSPSIIAKGQERLERVYMMIFEETRQTTPQQKHVAIKRQHEPSYSTLSPNQQAERIIAHGIKTSTSFSAYFGGDSALWGEGKKHPSKSEADWHFCLMLAYRTYGNTTLMDMIFRKSGLFDAKWDRPTEGAKTYGQITIEKAIRAERHI